MPIPKEHISGGVDICHPSSQSDKCDQGCDRDTCQRLNSLLNSLGELQKATRWYQELWKASRWYQIKAFNVFCKVFHSLCLYFSSVIFSLSTLTFSPLQHYSNAVDSVVFSLTMFFWDSSHPLSLECSFHPPPSD